MRLAIAHRGFVWLELETRGPRGARLALRPRDRRDRPDGAGPRRPGRARPAAARGRKLHPLLGGASTHAALIEGGTEPSTYAQRCVAKVERRTLPGETVALRRGADARDRGSRDGHDDLLSRAARDAARRGDRRRAPRQRGRRAGRDARDRRRPVLDGRGALRRPPASRPSCSGPEGPARTSRRSGSTSTTSSGRPRSCFAPRRSSARDGASDAARARAGLPRRVRGPGRSLAEARGSERPRDVQVACGASGRAGARERRRRKPSSRPRRAATASRSRGRAARSGCGRSSSCRRSRIRRSSRCSRSSAPTSASPDAISTRRRTRGAPGRRREGLPFFEDGAEPLQYEAYEAVGDEILDQLPAAPAGVVVPIGNGALAGGVAAALGRRAPAALRVGVVARSMPVMAESYEAGKPVDAPTSARRSPTGSRSGSRSRSRSSGCTRRSTGSSACRSARSRRRSSPATTPASRSSRRRRPRSRRSGSCRISGPTARWCSS